MRRKKGSELGQAVVLLLAVVVAMAALALWVTTIQGFVMTRLRTQDGGDAAALAAARWQAAGLNLCGELNLIQAYMLADSEDNLAAAQALHELRQRVQLTAPLLGFLSAQRVAAANGMEEIPEAADYLRELRETVMPLGLYEGAEADLQELLGMLLQEPITAFPLTPPVDQSVFPTWLVEQDFYEAVLGRDWCWFWFHAYGFLQHYRGYRDFGRVPELNTEPFFGLRLGEREASFEVLGLEAEMSSQLVELGHPGVPPKPAEESGAPAVYEREAEAVVVDGEEKRVSWTTFNGKWGEWKAMQADELPLGGMLRKQYNYEGASVVVGVQREGATWMAAAKAFGSVAGENPTSYDVVLGGFDAVRLIPIDAADAGIRGLDFAWLRHVRHHVRDYALRGVTAEGCRYCRALRLWDQAAFRAEATAWLALYGSTCRRPRPGRGDSGGSHYGH